MKQEIEAKHKSILHFDRVWVREAVFVDIEGETAVVARGDLGGLGLTLEVKTTFSEGTKSALVTLRATLRTIWSKE